MSILRGGDEAMHYSDGSHRWISPYGTDDQRTWEEQIREHQRRHRDRMGLVRRPHPAAVPPPWAGALRALRRR